MNEDTLAEIDAVLRRVDREIWIVTATDGTRSGGLTATWVSSASIDREHPVMMLGIAPNHFTAELIDASGCAGLHLVSRGDASLAMNFALGSGRERDKFAGIETFTAETGAPLLRRCAAWLDTRVFARLATGDRIFYWVDVLAAGTIAPGSVLREHELFAQATPQEKQALIANRDADVTLQRPRFVAWRQALPEYLKPIE